jgi:hypothetical protein
MGGPIVNVHSPDDGEQLCPFSWHGAGLIAIPYVSTMIESLFHENKI